MNVEVFSDLHREYCKEYETASKIYIKYWAKSKLVPITVRIRLRRSLKNLRDFLDKHFGRMPQPIFPHYVTPHHLYDTTNVV